MEDKVNNRWKLNKLNQDSSARKQTQQRGDICCKVHEQVNIVVAYVVAHKRS